MKQEIGPSYHFESILPLVEVQDRIDRRVYTDQKELQNLLKMRVGWEIALRVKDGETIGLGSGSTSEAAIRAIGSRMNTQGKLHLNTVNAVATSRSLGDLASTFGIVVSPFDETLKSINLEGIPYKDIDWGFDGADEVEVLRNEDEITGFRIIKGGGGAHTAERAVALRCKQWVVIVDESKVVAQLGKFQLPVEVKPEQKDAVRQELVDKYHPKEILLKMKKGTNTAFQTDLGNAVLDVYFAPGQIKSQWEKEWLLLSGVIDTGLFIDEIHPSEVMVSNNDGTIEHLIPKKNPSITVFTL